MLGYYVYYNFGVVDQLILMRNEGPSGTDSWNFDYTYLPLGSIYTGQSNLAWSDVDTDGDMDLVLGSEGEAVIYRNDSSTLVLSDTDLPGYWEENSQAYFDLRSISSADFDNDGDLDLLIPSVPDFNNFTYITSLMRNDGPNGTGGINFSKFDSIFPSTSHAQSLWADHDGDGDLDLLLVNIAPLYDDGFIRRYQNDGNGVFTGENILGSLRIEHGEAQWGDYDSDGDLDIMVAGNVRETNGTYTPMTLRIYKNNNDVYTKTEIIPNPSSQGWFDFTAATWADYDSDGDMDILLAGHYNSGVQIEGRAKIYKNENGVFSDSGNDLPAPHAAGSHGGAFSWLDIDGDGDLDYLIAGEYFVQGGNGLVEAQIHLYRNDTPGQNAAPVPPSGLSFTQVSDSSVLLTWDPGSDDHTGPDALTYDLKLYRDGLPVSFPMRTPEPGNISNVNSWMMNSLETGDYFWTVGTVDAAYIGSPLATGQFSLFPVSLDENTQDVSPGLQVSQNHPNPFYGTTTIKYSIPDDGLVTLEVYSFQGRLIKILADEIKKAGMYSSEFNAAGLPEGFYFYRLRARSAEQTRKMVVKRK